VRRREKVDPDSPGVPARLATFTASDWPGTYKDAVTAWYEGRDDWLAAGRELPYLDGAGFPDMPFDATDV